MCVQRRLRGRPPPTPRCARGAIADGWLAWRRHRDQHRVGAAWEKRWGPAGWAEAAAMALLGGPPAAEGQPLGRHMECTQSGTQAGCRWCRSWLSRPVQRQGAEGGEPCLASSELGHERAGVAGGLLRSPRPSQRQRLVPTRGCRTTGSLRPAQPWPSLQPGGGTAMVRAGDPWPQAAQAGPLMTVRPEAVRHDGRTGSRL